METYLLPMDLEGAKRAVAPTPFKPDKQKIILYKTPQKIQTQNSHNKTDFYSKQHIIF